jgi:predicted nucleic acid-binding protein
VVVVDASIVVEMVLSTERARRAAAAFGRSDVTWHAPHLIDVEVTSALRRLGRQGFVEEAARGLARFVVVAIERYSHEDLVPRIWSLRGSMSAYDATYVALAEALQVPLFTCDTRLANARGHRATIELVG